MTKNTFEANTPLRFRIDKSKDMILYSNLTSYILSWYSF